MEKLLPRSRLLVPRDVAPLPVEEKRKEDSFTKAQRPIYKATVTDGTVTHQHGDTAKDGVVDTANETLHGTAEEYRTPACASSALGVPATGERLFVFRDPPESCDRAGAPKRKGKKNFLNLKKGSVAPTNLP